MSTQPVRNALTERDYWIAAPVSIVWLLWVYPLIGSSHRLDWIGGAAALCLGSVILGLAVFYHPWARWVITVWYVGLLANWAIESHVGGAGLSLGIGSGLIFACGGALVVVLWVRHLEKRKQSRSS